MVFRGYLRQLLREVCVYDADVLCSLRVHIFLQPGGLMPIVKELNTLLQADGEEQPAANSGDVDENVLPRMRGMGDVYVKHGGGRFH